MIAMVWPWGIDVPALPQIVVFAAGALWFVCSALWHGGFRLRTLLGSLFRAVMMSAMVWMVAVMDSGGMTAGQGSGGAGQAMAGMDMSAGGGVATNCLAGTGRKLTTAVLALVLLAFTLRRLARAFDAASATPGGGPGPVADARADAWSPACHAAMALGMAVMFVLLL
ncbi:DUF5134 domain-containing protein [Streptomyces sp. NPDC020096]